MRWSIVLAALLTLAVLAPPGAPATGTITVDASGSGPADVDLVDDALAKLRFRLDGDNYSAAAGPIRSAYVRLARAGEPVMELAMARTDAVWTVDLPVATPDLVTGTWKATFVGLRNAGSQALGNRTLEVAARDSLAPQLALAKPASPIVAGAGDSVDLSVRDPLLRKVTFEFSGVPPVPMAAPYAFDTDILPEGRTEVTFTASDRAGHKASLKADIVRDTTAPLVNLTVPERVYAGVPFLATARVVEAGPYALRFSVNGTEQPEVKVAGTAAPGANRTTSFTVTPPSAPGNLSIAIEAIDQVGASAGNATLLRVERPVTDIRLTNLSVEGTQFAQRPVVFTATLEQVEAVAPLDVSVALGVGGQSLVRVQELPAAGARLLTWEVQLAGGRYKATANATVPGSANETAPGDEESTLAVEVFLGRVLHNGTTYNIRAGANGLPSSAVEEGKTKSHPLRLVDSGRGVAYRFTLDGNRSVDWDPLDPLGQASATETGTGTSTATSTAGGSKGAPGAGPLVALLMVALAALVQRRRL